MGMTDDKGCMSPNTERVFTYTQAQNDGRLSHITKDGE
jgi:hypothetical protein